MPDNLIHIVENMTKTHYIRLSSPVYFFLETLCGLRYSYQDTDCFVVRDKDQPTCLTCQKIEKKEKEND